MALEVGDLEAALAFYGRIFAVTLRGRAPGMAFIDLGDQFLALSEGRSQAPDRHRHVGIVVDAREAARRAAIAAGAQILPGAGLDLLDPWGNRLQIVEYGEVQFTKTPDVLRGMGLDGLEKSAAALEDLARKGMGPAAGR